MVIAADEIGCFVIQPLPAARSGLRCRYRCQRGRSHRLDHLVSGLADRPGAIVVVGERYRAHTRDRAFARLGEQRGRRLLLFSPVRDIRAAISPVTIGVEKEVPLHLAMP